MLEWAKIVFKVIYDRPMRCRVLGFRPVVVCIIQAAERDEFLFISPTQKPTAWMPPQEGIEVTESIERASVRGVGAELGIAENQLHFRRSVWLGREVIPEQHGERDIQYSIMGMRGKAYYASLIKVSANTVVTVNPAEITRYEWLGVDAIAMRLSSNSNRKQRLIRKAFQKLIGRAIPDS
jgi:putative (di)nucleoside polyphosphate hydrolase